MEFESGFKGSGALWMRGMRTEGTQSLLTTSPSKLTFPELARYFRMIFHHPYFHIPAHPPPLCSGHKTFKRQKNPRIGFWVLLTQLGLMRDHRILINGGHSLAGDPNPVIPHKFHSSWRLPLADPTRNQQQWKAKIQGHVCGERFENMRSLSP